VSDDSTYVAEEREVDRAAADMLRLWGTSLTSVDGDAPGKLDWFYRVAPGGPARAVMLAAPGDGGGAAVGCIGIGFRRTWLGDHPLRAALLADLAVDPGHRTLLPALTLVRRAREVAGGTADFQYGFPNRKAVGVFRRVGYQQLGTMRRRVRVLRSERYLRRPIPVPLLARLGGALADAVLTAVGTVPRLRAASAYRLSFQEAPDARLDDLFAAARRRHRVIADRSREFLHWRFFARAGGAELATLVRRADGALRAYAVVFRDDGVAHLSDFLAASDPELEALLALLTPALRARGCSSASARFLGAGAIARLLERSGFRPREDGRAVVIDAGGDAALAATLGDPESHYLTDADEDN
jgi:hypothetical protein